MHHYIHRSLGGSNQPHNLICLCWKCHAVAHGTAMPDYPDYVTPEYIEQAICEYLSDFYADMTRWSFNLQIYFLNKRFKEVVEISKSEDTIIQDRTIFEDAKIFAPNLHDQGMMSDRDFANYADHQVGQFHQ